LYVVDHVHDHDHVHVHDVDHDLGYVGHHDHLFADYKNKQNNISHIHPHKYNTNQKRFKHKIKIIIK
jgi:hypothetical protein